MRALLDNPREAINHFSVNATSSVHKPVGSKQEMDGEKHKGPYVHGHEEDRKGRAWDGAKK